LVSLPRKRCSTGVRTSLAGRVAPTSASFVGRDRLPRLPPSQSPGPKCPSPCSNRLRNPIAPPVGRALQLATYFSLRGRSSARGTADPCALGDTRPADCELLADRTQGPLYGSHLIPEHRDFPRCPPRPALSQHPIAIKI